MAVCNSAAKPGGVSRLGLVGKWGRALRTLGCVAVATAAVAAQAAVVTVQFEAAVGDIVFANYAEGGLRFSPNSHRDGVAGPTGQWLGWDTLARPNMLGFTESNPDWLGSPDLSPNTNGGVPVLPWMHVDADGALFSLLSVDVMAYQIEFLSSRGGHLLSSGMNPYPQALAFAGDEWTNVQWLLMRAISPGIPAGIDNLVVSVPEPASPELVLMALSLAVVSLRRRRLGAN